MEWQLWKTHARSPHAPQKKRLHKLLSRPYRYWTPQATISWPESNDVPWSQMPHCTCTVCTTHAKTPGSQEKARYYQHYCQAIYHQRDKVATEGGVCNITSRTSISFFPFLHLINPSDLRLHLTPPRFSVWAEWIAVELALRIECRDY